MIIALTGTPGSGKTTLAEALSQKGLSIASAQEIAERHQCILGKDEQRNSMIIDTDCLDTVLSSYDPVSDCLIIEGHIAQVLKTVKYVIVLRCHPNVLTKRLQEKYWPEKKIKENIASEVLGVILSEAIEVHGIGKVVELDSSQKSIQELTDIIVRLVRNSMKDMTLYQPGTIDWLPVLLQKEYSWMVDENGT